MSKLGFEVANFETSINFINRKKPIGLIFS
jgi:hypothetical protein